MGVLQKEQARIASERQVASIRLQSVITETEALQENLDWALGRLDRCDEFYLAGGPAARRELSFGLFHAMYIDVEGVVEVDLAAPFVQLLDPDLPTRIGDEITALGTVDDDAEGNDETSGTGVVNRRNSALRCRGRSSNESLLVGVKGLEPST